MLDRFAITLRPWDKLSCHGSLYMLSKQNVESGIGKSTQVRIEREPSLVTGVQSHSGHGVATLWQVESKKTLPRHLPTLLQTLAGRPSHMPGGNRREAKFENILKKIDS